MDSVQYSRGHICGVMRSRAAGAGSTHSGAAATHLDGDGDGGRAVVLDKVVHGRRLPAGVAAVHDVALPQAAGRLGRVRRCSSRTAYVLQWRCDIA